MNNFTVIIPPLYPHYQDKTQGIQQFEQFYDLERLALALKFIKLDHFLQQTTNNRNQTMIDCYMQQEKLGYVIYYANDALKTVQNYHRVSINFHQHVSLSSKPSMEEIIQKARNCTSIFLNILYSELAHLSSATNTHLHAIFPHLHRTALVQRFASKLMSALPELLIGNCSRKNLTTLVVAHMRLGDRGVMSVQKYMEQILHLAQSGIHFTHVHIMCPHLNSTDVYQLATRLPVGVTTTEILFNHARFGMDDYLFDVLEQEIAFQAPIFIASPWTTYSATVVFQKLYQKKGSVYMFSSGTGNRTFPVTKENAVYSD